MARLKINDDCFSRGRKNQSYRIDIKIVNELSKLELEDISYAVKQIINHNDNFNLGLMNSDSDSIKQYYNGILLIPGRILVIAKLDQVIVGAIQIIKPCNNRSNFYAVFENHFVAPWARNMGIAKALLKKAENIAKKENFNSVKLNILENQKQAINLYESNGYIKWGVLNKCQMINDEIIAGHFYYKDF